MYLKDQEGGSREGQCGRRGRAESTSPSLRFWKISLAEELRMNCAGEGEGRAKGTNEETVADIRGTVLVTRTRARAEEREGISLSRNQKILFYTPVSQKRKLKGNKSHPWS